MQLEEVESLDAKIKDLEKQLSIVSLKFDQIEKNMEYYEKWYMELLDKAAKTTDETRKFLARFTEDDISHLERIIEAVHGV